MQTTISHQVRTLEAQLGQQLFIRHAGQTTLTKNGGHLQRPCTENFDQLDRLCKGFKSASNRRALHFASLARAFASKWPTPRLPDFWATHAIQLNLMPSSETVDLQRERMDLGIRCGDGHGTACKPSY